MGSSQTTDIYTLYFATESGAQHNWNGIKDGFVSISGYYVTVWDIESLHQCHILADGEHYKVTISTCCPKSAAVFPEMTLDMARM